MFHFDLGAVYFFVCVCGGFILPALIKRLEEYVFTYPRHHDITGAVFTPGSMVLLSGR